MPARPSTNEHAAALATTSVGAGQRLVLVHGFTQTGRSWAPVARHLVVSHEVVTVDLPGHGRSASVVARHLDEAGALVVSAGGHATYVGYSMGGRVALHAAYGAPDAVERLVLVGATPGMRDDAERAERLRSDAALASRLDGSAGEELTLEEFLAEWLSGPLFSDLDRDVANIDARRENTTFGLSRALRTLGTGTQQFDEGKLAALEMPVLVVAGARDDKFCAIAKQLCRLIGTNASFETIEDAGHAAPFENPSGFAAVLERWSTTHLV